ncbi:cell division protein PerM [Isoptericola sp. NPDC055881]
MSAPPGTRPTRTVRTVDGAAPGRGGERFAAATSGAWAAVQGIVLSGAVVVLLAVVGALGGSADSAWTGAVGVATGLWLLGHGVPMAAGAGVVTVIPLGIGALAVFTAYVSVKRSALPTLPAWVGAATTYAAVTCALALATAGVAGGDGLAAPGPRLALAALGGLVVGGVGAALGILVPPDRPLVVVPGGLLDRAVPDVVRLGLQAGTVALFALLGLGAALTGVWVVAGRATSEDVVTGLDPGWIGGVVFAVAQLALLPNVVLWATAWLAGPGFAVGQDTSFAPGGTTTGPLPAVPLLGALPGPDWSGTTAAVAGPLVVVACGLLAGWFAWRRLDPERVRWADVAQVLAGVVLLAGVVTGLLQWWAGGAAGAGRLAAVGADPVLLGAVVAVEVGAGAAIVLVCAYLDVGARLRRS